MIPEAHAWSLNPSHRSKRPAAGGSQQDVEANNAAPLPFMHLHDLHDLHDLPRPPHPLGTRFALPKGWNRRAVVGLESRTASTNSSALDSSTYLGK